MASALNSLTVSMGLWGNLGTVTASSEKICFQDRLPFCYFVGFSRIKENRDGHLSGLCLVFTLDFNWLKCFPCVWTFLRVLYISHRIVGELNDTHSDSPDWLHRSYMMQYHYRYCKLEYLWGYSEGTLQLLHCAVTLVGVAVAGYPHSYSNSSIHSGTG